MPPHPWTTPLNGSGALGEDEWSLAYFSIHLNSRGQTLQTSS
jgi:hypothetical protein